MKKTKSAKQRRAKISTCAPDNPVMAGQELLRQARLDTISAVGLVLGHEVSNLLGALTTCVQVLRRNTQLSKDDAELLEIIQSGSRRLSEIIAAFSTFGRPRPLHIEPVDLHALIDQTLARLQRHERCSSYIVIHRDFDPSARNAELDREQFGQVMWNLLLNAVQAMGDHGDLKVRIRRVGKRIKIVVQDTGPGIPLAILQKVFEPLYTTKSRGAGLGLAIARNIVEKHGGQLTVDSSGAAGACFTIVLPMTAKPPCNDRGNSTRDHKNTRCR